MPSHSIKQAKVMSAIAHGWRPKGLDIPVKVAKDFHAADAGHKYGKKYAEGGNVFDWSGVGEAMPEHIGRERLVDPVANAAIGAVTMYPRYVKATVDAARTAPGSEEARQAYGDVGAATGELGLGMIGPKGPPSTSGVFVGPYGAIALRNAAKESGNLAAENALTHPVVGKSIEKEVKAMPEWMRDAYRNSAQESRDDWARAALESGKPDASIWYRSGWERTTEGAPVKEVVDTKARLVPIKGTDKFRLEHPAGDFHKLYDIPPISFDPNMPKGELGHTILRQYRDGRVVPDRIVLGGSPTKENIKAKTSTALHELQHFIDSREGRVIGDPRWATRKINDPLFNQDYFPGLNTEENARYQTYLKNIGETRARNVQERLKHSYRYLEKPEFTEDVTRGLQWKAGGGSVGNFNPERANAFGMAKQGLIKSSVPGRTDKLNMDVPSGSYIIPADVVSARGEGNTAAGASILDKMFNKGPYGMGVKRAKGPRIGARTSSLTRLNKRGFAGGGNTGQPTPIVAAGGEYMVHPETVAALGHGDMDLGHAILDKFVKDTRAQHISTLKGLKPPKGSS